MIIAELNLLYMILWNLGLWQTSHISMHFFPSNSLRIKFYPIWKWELWKKSRSQKKIWYQLFSNPHLTGIVFKIRKHCYSIFEVHWVHFSNHIIFSFFYIIDLYFEEIEHLLPLPILFQVSQDSGLFWPLLSAQYSWVITSMQLQFRVSLMQTNNSDVFHFINLLCGRAVHPNQPFNISLMMSHRYLQFNRFTS